MARDPGSWYQQSTHGATFLDFSMFYPVPLYLLQCKSHDQSHPNDMDFQIVKRKEHRNNLYCKNHSKWEPLVLSSQNLSSGSILISLGEKADPCAPTWSKRTRTCTGIMCFLRTSKIDDGLLPHYPSQSMSNVLGKLDALLTISTPLHNVVHQGQVYWSRPWPRPVLTNFTIPELPYGHLETGRRKSLFGHGFIW